MKSEIFDQLVEFFKRCTGTMSAQLLEEDLSDYLSSTDFSAYDIRQALKWLRSFTSDVSVVSELYETATQRVMIPQELNRFDLKAISYLNGLLERKSLSTGHFELIVDRAMMIECSSIELRHVKWIGLMLLANSQAQEGEGEDENWPAYNPLLLELLQSTGPQVMH